MADTSDEATALADNIDRKGRNAYYYAHAHKADGPVWDGKEEPKLLKTESSSVDATASPIFIAVPITNYAWSDEDTKVKIYIDLPDIGELDKEKFVMDWKEDSFSFTVMDYKEKNHRLTYSKLFAEIESGVFKVKPQKIIVTLKKMEERSWPCLNVGTAQQGR